MSAKRSLPSRLLNAVIRRLLRMSGLTLSPETLVFADRDDLHSALEARHRERDPVQRDRNRLSGLFELQELEVSDVMRHRTVMRALNADDPPEVLVRTVLESPYTRMPVWRNSTENIIGVLHAKDLLRTLADVEADGAPVDVVKIAQRPWFVPDSTSLKDQLAAFLKRKVHFAVVVDEYGEVQGIVTLEDILEEIVGEFEDEDTLDNPHIHPQADGRYVIDGAASIRDMNKSLGWHLPSDGPKTLNGLVTEALESIPESAVCLKIGRYRLEILETEENRASKVLIWHASSLPPAL